MEKKKLNAIVDTPLQGEGSLWRMATVLSGVHKGLRVCIMVEFSDGYCICDMGSDPKNLIEIIHVKRLRKWDDVDSVQ